MLVDSKLRKTALKTDDPCYLVLETKGWDPLEEVKASAACRWVDAVTADGTFGRWFYAVAEKPEDVNERISDVIAAIAEQSS